MSMKSWLCVPAFVLPMLASPAAAQQAPTTPAAPSHAAEEGEEHRNELALVLAGTRERAEDEHETSFTVGGEYERHVVRHLGIVAEFEYVKGPGSWIFVVPVIFHPTSGLKLFTGPGLERARVSEGDVPEPGSTSPEHHSLFLWRTGTGYSWEFLERYAVSPTVSLDLIREDGEWTRAFVFGMSFGIAF